MNNKIYNHVTDVVFSIQMLVVVSLVLVVYDAANF